MSRVIVAGASFALALGDRMNLTLVAAAMDAGVSLHEVDGHLISTQGMSALLALRERGEAIVCLDATLTGLWDTLLGWGLAVTDQPLGEFAGFAVIINCPPLALTEAMARAALEVA